MKRKKQTMRQDFIRIINLIKDDSPITVGGVQLPLVITKSDTQHWTENEIKLIGILIEAEKITGRVVSTSAQTLTPSGYHALKITLEGYLFLEKLEEEERTSRMRYKLTKLMESLFLLAAGALITLLVEWVWSMFAVATPK